MREWERSVSEGLDAVLSMKRGKELNPYPWNDIKTVKKSEIIVRSFYVREHFKMAVESLGETER
jgi:hypothetical protein